MCIPDTPRKKEKSEVLKRLKRLKVEKRKFNLFEKTQSFWGPTSLFDKIKSGMGLKSEEKKIEFWKIDLTSNGH